MSVGPARLREDTEVVRRGCIAKGEDPGLVDQALVVDAQRRDLLGKADAMRSQRNQISESIGLAIRGGAAANGPQVAQLREQSTWIGAEIAGLDARLAEVTTKLDELLYRIPNPPDPGVPVGGEEASLIVRTWGEPLTPHEEPQRGEREAWVRRPHWEIGDRARHHRPRGRRQGHGLGLPAVSGRGVGPAACAHRLLPRPPHPRARHDRGLAAGPRQ